MTPIEQIENLMAEVADLKAKLEESTGKLTASQIDSTKLAELESAIAKHGEAITAKDGEIAALKTERDELKARAEKAEGAMALKPEAFNHISDGTKPVETGKDLTAKTFTRKQIAAMSPREYRENRDAIMQAMNIGNIK